VFCASPDYLARHGTPMTPEDLAGHNCVVSRGAVLNSSWPVQRGNEIGSVRVSGNFVANNGDAIRVATVAGLGITMAARWQMEDDLAAGRVVEVLHDYVTSNRAIYAVLPRQGSLTPKVRAFVDFLKTCCADIR
jgi:DNA-binding transcriptional LysR family regulator